MIKVLHYIPAFESGGIESLVLSLYQNIDHSHMQFDFLVEKNIPEEYKKIIDDLGGTIYTLPKMTDFKNILKYCKQLRTILKENQYQVFHCHSWDTRPFPMLFAKMYKIRVRIAHVHFIDFNNKHHLFIQKFFQKMGIYFSNMRLSCSKEAGEKHFKNKSFYILNNGIDISKYDFNVEARNTLRKKYNILKKDIVYINVGRLTPLKNQYFLIDVFYYLYEKNKNQKMFIIGSGELKKDLERHIRDLKLETSIFILDDIYDVSNYLSMADIFMFPSISEGLGIAYIEAQVNGLYCYVSDGVPACVSRTKRSKVLHLNQGAENWSKEIEKNEFFKREENNDLTKFQDYDIKNIASKYQELILNEIK